MTSALEKLEAGLEPLENKAPLFKGMIYGENGVGKTVAAMRIAQLVTPADKTILFLDTADGWVSLQNHPKLKERVIRRPIKQLEIFQPIAEAISTGYGSFANVGTVIIDEHSTAHFDSLLNLVQKRASEGWASTKESSRGKDPDTVEWPDYDAGGNRTIRFTRPLFGLPINLILIAHDKSEKIGGVTKTAPGYNLAASKKLREQCSVVAYMRADIEQSDNDVVYQRTLQVHPTRTIVAKSRIGGLGVTVTVEELLAQIKEWMKGNAEEISEEQATQEIPVTEHDVTTTSEGLDPE